MADLGDFGVVGGGRRRSPGDSAGFMSRARRLLSLATLFTSLLLILSCGSTIAADIFAFLNFSD